VTDTATGTLYHRVPLLRVFPAGSPQLVNDAAADAYYVVDWELYFLRKPTSGPQTLAELAAHRSRPKPARRRPRRTAA
jgi:hypothetical protein